MGFLVGAIVDGRPVGTSVSVKIGRMIITGELVGAFVNGTDTSFST